MSVTLDSVSVRYGEMRAVESLSLDIESGERFVLMGPSGSGKSTLLRAIAGLEPLEAGSIVIDGTDVTALPPHRRPVGMMFQEYALFPHMTVLDNVTYGLRMNGVDRTAARASAMGLLELAGLSGFGDRKPGSLSGGERQRVALVRTLAPEPSLVMLDEPLGSLDLSLRESLLAQTRSILTQVNATSLYVTHDRTEAFAFAQRLAIMHNGRIVRTGTPQDVWEDPGTTFVARFIGHPNVLPGSSVGLDTPWVLIPPEAVGIGAEGTLEALIVDSVFSDGHHRVSAALDDGWTLRFDATQRAHAGDRVRLAIDTTLIRPLSNDGS